MAYKLALFSALVVVARAGVIGVPPVLARSVPYAYEGAPIGYAAPLAYANTVIDDEYDPHPQYSYSYGVQDDLTGDSKSQYETRDGDVVQGRYSLIEADGTRRIVDYTADSINGFNAVVHKEPAVYAPVAAKVASPVLTNPIAYSAPLGYAAPHLYP